MKLEDAVRNSERAIARSADTLRRIRAAEDARRKREIERSAARVQEMYDEWDKLRYENTAKKCKHYDELWEKEAKNDLFDELLTYFDLREGL